MKFLHAADVHLDSPLRGLERYDGAPVDVLRSATRRALENLVDLAIAERVDLLLVAGDVYDGEWRDFNTGLFFAAQMARLRAADIRVLTVAGNHDAASVIARGLPLPANVRVLGCDRPETVVLDDLGVAIHGQGFATRSVTEDLSLGYPDAVPGLVNVGLLHTSADGRAGHAPYAPCTVAGLRSRGYDYWALGHVHVREELSRSPWVVFPGNVQGRHARETGPKGATLVTVEDGRVAAVEHRSLDVVRWAHLRVDVCAASSDADVVDLVADGVRAAADAAEGRLLAVRIEPTGACLAHERLVAHSERVLNEIRARVTDEGDGRVWVERVRLGTSTTGGRRAAPAEDGPLAELAAGLRDAPDPGALDELAAVLADLRRKLPADLREGEDPLDLARPETVERLTRDAGALLLGRLLGEEAA